MTTNACNRGNERISNIDRPVPERDPGSRRRLDGEAMRDRDTQIAKMLAQHVPYRTIAVRLDMSYGSLQQAVRRLRGEVPERERKVRVPQHKSRFDRSTDEDW
jgi:DNA-binding CsgD family transcriptional regulator